MIAYTFHPSGSFLRRGGFRTFFQVSGDWRRLSAIDWLIVALLAGWTYYENVDLLNAYSQEVQAVAVAVALAMFLVFYISARIVMSVLALTLGVRARPMPTTVEIVPGSYVCCTDMAQMRFEWNALTRARAFDDMYILMFRVSPVHDMPVFISREHLNVKQDDQLAASLATVS
jgi:hypothetical protein